MVKNRYLIGKTKVLKFNSFGITYFKNLYSLLNIYLILKKVLKYFILWIFTQNTRCL